MTDRGSKYSLVFFDNDGTLNTYRSTWEYLHRYFGTWEPAGREILEAHMRGRTPYDAFAKDSAKLWKGFPLEGFLTKLRMIDIRPGVPEVAEALRARGIKMAVLSSGFSLWRGMWRERIGVEWDHYHANDLVFDAGERCTGEIEMHVTDNVPGLDKGSWVERISEQEGIPESERVYVGDGWGDVSGFQKCAFGIAVDPNMEEVRRAAAYVLGPEEFPRVLDILLD